MDTERHLAILRAEGALVAAVPADALDAPVPAIDDWTVERVVRHLGKLHQWVAGAMALGPDQGMADVAPIAGMPTGPACLEAYRESLATLLADMDARDPAEPKPTFAGPGTVGWWARRQAHEVAVHRVDAHDAIHAAGGAPPAPMAVDGAADAIDEWARFFLTTRFVQRFGPLPPELDGATIHLHGTDDPPPDDGAEWLLTFQDGGVTVEATHAKGDVAMRGPVEHLLLALWRRRPLADLDVVGDRSVAERLLALATF